ncbi:MAG: fructose 1,6-bisphosphatase [Candidatus Syntrophonatronum acetioxidans]|uniref:Fructose-1,6-bisphosphate aldolase/phosphatase n=1 Tax=Candidatus Syntrophonatronum acetioxidans TaxID=1795816 RepID=A0A424YD91_9FIRM|nr:MAG: fructose 1,6-bisphosphatase [Candidatus Syntrophonatronum acetioxidans]
MSKKITLSVIKADVGGFVGHCDVHEALLEKASTTLKGNNILIDYHVTHVGDDINLIMTHEKGIDNEEVHQLAWNTFQACTEKARELKLYGAGQDLLADAFSGNIRGLGPGVAEMSFKERESEPVVVFMADKTDPGAWNYPLYKIFADPFNTAGLVIDPKMHDGFKFEVHDLKNSKKVFFDTPEELYDLLVFIGAPGQFAIKAIYHKETGEIASSSSTQRLNLIAGRYIGKDDPVCIVRCQSGLPAVGEALEPFSNPHLVSGWMRGSHVGPLMPVPVEKCPARFDGPPRVVALGFQIAEGKLIGPQDFFADVSYDEARKKANEIANYMRSLGPFEPHRLPLNDMEYTTLPLVMNKLKDRFEDID